MALAERGRANYHLADLKLASAMRRARQRNN
jgi:hypothetical protein